MMTSTSPVGMLGLTVPSGRGRTLPVNSTTHSGRTVSAILKASRRCLGVERALDDAGAVAYVDEDEPAVVAALADPAGEADLVARRLQRAASRTYGIASSSGRRAWSILVV